MKNNHVLIDYENIQPDVARLLAQPVFKVWIFVGAQQNKVKFDLIELVQKKGSDAKVIKMSASGPNVLDFHMSFYLGELVAKDPESFLHVVTGDGGMDRLLEHLRDRGMKVQRHKSVADIPLIKPSPHVPKEEKLSRAMEYLINRGVQRPASLKTLRGSISALFQPKLDESEVMTLIGVLAEHGVLAVDGTKVVYGLPD
ncbi:PIN domain-containing protein [Paucibacter sp. XJ19-41]|uniref:PIN domain-containing protein n=1 Tax=Paucibacter sp. XJ19-41 TaxID=2927824 RepID=UPI00234A4AE7|nr:PIN domain-containing protein [Paucibacter sp. XJ19-41]MDC6167037.1 PIN domain-containing protein [Paucibacter sp. XJ19-41]